MADLTRRARQAAAAAAAIALASLVALGCRSRDDSRYPGPYGREVAEAIPRIEQSIGLKFKTPPKLEVRSKDQVRQFLEQQFDESRAARELAGQAAVYKRLGVLPDTLQLRAMFVNLLSEQIVGFYDPKTKALYVVEGSTPEVAGITVRHELVHALQDQYLNLDSLQNADMDNDHRLAAQSVIEGQAIFDQVGKNVAAIGGWDRVRDVIREQQGAMPHFTRAPLIVQETLLFPYLTGADFVRRFLQANPGKAPIDALPASSEQVMHERAYSTTPGQGDAPTAITLPAPRGGASLVYENNLGEFETRVFLYHHLQNQKDAYDGASGWDGDRYALLRTPQGEALVWVSVWDSPVDAGEFHDKLTGMIKGRRGVTGRALSSTTVEIQGRPAVVFADVPSGVNPQSLLPIAEVKLGQ